MAASKDRILVTSALPYANGPLHIGHVAGAYLSADIFVRYQRLSGRDVLFVCGSDEHGAAITLRAKKEGISPQEIVDKYHKIIGDSFVELGIDFDIFHRTSDPLHHQTAQGFFKNLSEKRAFDVETSEQYYDEENDQFLADRYITGTCPKCNFENAYGDQCENCGSALSPLDLIDPKSTLSGNKPVLKSTSHWYLPMGNHEAWLKEYIENGKLDGQDHHDAKAWKNHVIGQCKSWIDAGLHSRAMTRDLDWGVKVPLEGADGKVLYVWLDAPIGYISATKAWAEMQGQNWKDWWQNDDTRLIHFIGKDNIVFHCIIFPIILKAHGDYILPENVPANAFMNLEGDKISTSRDWAVWVDEYLRDFEGKQDELRYVLNAIMPEAKDSEFTWSDYRERINNELADILGNFMNRAVVLTHKYYGGVVPALGTTTAEDQAILDEMARYPQKVATAIEGYRFREAQAEAMNLARLGNRYLAESEPWKVVKTDPARVETIMHITLQIAANLSIVLQPFMPRIAGKIGEAFGQTSKTWADAGTMLLKEGDAIEKLGILIAKVEEATVAAEVEKLQAKAAAKLAANKKTEPVKDNIDFSQFEGLDLRIATILEAEKVAKTKKLLKFKVDIGMETRTVVSGIAEFYKPEELIGQQVTMIANLAPRKIKGIESQGMILMAENAAGELQLIQPNEETDAGAVVR